MLRVQPSRLAERFAGCRGFALAAALLALSVVPSTARATTPAEGRAAIERFGCVRCHSVPGFTVSRQDGCVSCHQAIVARPRSGLRRSATVEHFIRVPELSRITWRVRADYLVTFLQDPHDVRPHLEESMPRLPVGEREARAMVAYLADRAGRPDLPAAPAPDRANVEPGRALFVTAGCPSCHVFGNVDFGTGADAEFYRGMRNEALLAPNLRFVRDRLDPTAALAWILDPTTVDPSTTMPRPNLSRADALKIRDFLFLGDTGTPVRAARAPTASDVTPSSRAVAFAEVRRVFQRAGCVHCHSHASRDASQALGFTGSRVDLDTEAGIRAGWTDAQGTRHSVLEPPAGGGPPDLVARLLRRHAERARDVVPVYRDALRPVRRTPDSAPVGMPLGLPPLSLDDIRLVATWVAASGG